MIFIKPQYRNIFDMDYYDSLVGKKLKIHLVEKQSNDLKIKNYNEICITKFFERYFSS